MAVVLVVVPLLLFLKLRSATSWRPRKVVEGGWSEHLAFSPDGQAVAVCGFATSGTPSLRLRRVADGSLLQPPPTQGDSVDNVLWAPHAQLLVAANHHVSEWNKGEIQPLFELGYVQEMALAPRNDWLVAAGQKGQGSDIVLWDVASRRVQWRLPINLNGVNLALSGGELCVARQSMDKRGAMQGAVIRRFKLPASRVEHEFLVPHHLVNDIALSPTHPELLALTDNNGLNLIDTRTGHVLSFFAHTGYPGALGTLAFSPDGSLLASAVSTSSGGPASDILLFEVNPDSVPPLRHVRTLVGHMAWVTGLQFSPDGNTLASSGYDKTLRFWRIR